LTPSTVFGKNTFGKVWVRKRYTLTGFFGIKEKLLSGCVISGRFYGKVEEGNKNGKTAIASLDQAGQAAMRGHVYTAGDLLRLNRVKPKEASVESTVL
jgi:hypothetical protein